MTAGGGRGRRSRGREKGGRGKERKGGRGRRRKEKGGGTVFSPSKWGTSSERPDWSSWNNLIMW